MSLAGNGFTFKQFFVAHDQCGMKVSTDAIVLGAWVEIQQAQSILDLGAGSGVIALMLAQRTAPSATITAIELDAGAYRQACENVARSRWPDKIISVHQDIKDYVQRTTIGYDLIVTNPPYFDQGLDCRSSQRNVARYTNTLSHQQLLECCQRLLNPQGRLGLVLPCSVAGRFLELASKMGWYCGRSLSVQDSAAKAPHLLLLELAQYPLPEQQDTLIIRDDNRQYSAEYRQLAKDFYLSF